MGFRIQKPTWKNILYGTLIFTFSRLLLPPSPLKIAKTRNKIYSRLKIAAHFIREVFLWNEFLTHLNQVCTTVAIFSSETVRFQPLVKELWSDLIYLMWILLRIETTFDQISDEDLIPAWSIRSFLSKLFLHGPFSTSTYNYKSGSKFLGINIRSDYLHAVPFEIYKVGFQAFKSPSI